MSPAPFDFPDPFDFPKKSAHDCRGYPQLVEMGGIPSSELFQAQPIWEMSASYLAVLPASGGGRGI